MLSILLIPEIREGRKCILVKKDKLFEHKHLFALATSMGLIALGLIFVTLFSNYIGKLLYSVSGAIFLLVLTFRVLPTHLAKCNCYLFLQDALSISLAGAIEYFFTADETCLKNGPHFSYLFFFTWSSLVSAVCGLFGLALFQWKFKNSKVRRIFVFTTLLRICAAMFDIIITKRWNLKMGIPDKWMYMLGDNIVSPVISMIAFLPMVLLTSKLCTRGMESTMYALWRDFRILHVGFTIHGRICH